MTGTVVSMSVYRVVMLHEVGVLLDQMLDFSVKVAEYLDLNDIYCRARSTSASITLAQSEASRLSNRVMQIVEYLSLVNSLAKGKTNTATFLKSSRRVPLKAITDTKELAELLPTGLYDLRSQSLQFLRDTIHLDDELVSTIKQDSKLVSFRKQK